MARCESITPQFLEYIAGSIDGACQSCFEARQEQNIGKAQKAKNGVDQKLDVLATVYRKQAHVDISWFNAGFRKTCTIC
jgi:hypothetical protein